MDIETKCISRIAAVVSAIGMLAGSQAGFATRAEAASPHNGACVGFAGAVAGQKFAGLKCYLDSAPGDYVIRSTVKERDNAEQYRKLLRIPKRPFRCTLTSGGTMPFNGMETTSYKISNC